MRHILLIGFFLVTQYIAGAQTVSKEQWIIKLKHPANGMQVRSSSKLSMKSIYPNLYAQHTGSGLYTVELSKDISKSDIEDQIGEANIEYIEKDYFGRASSTQQETPNDPHFDLQWYLQNDGTFNSFAKKGADIGLLSAWEITKGTSEVTVAILDTGIDDNNMDFSGRIWTNEKEIPRNDIDDDGNGFVDDVNGWDFINEDNDPIDDGGHGNALAGIIGAAANNEKGVVGIDQKCKLMICKVLGSDQTGRLSQWAAGIYYAVDNGADIINMSMTSDKDLRVLSEAIKYAAERDVTIIASTGNSNTSDTFYPSGYESVVAVGSTAQNDERSGSFSNYGSHIDLVAPGSDIFVLRLGSNGAVTSLSGTSMSSAVVSGVAALLLSIESNLSSNELKTVLYKTAVDQVGPSNEDAPGWDQYYGFGRVDAGAAAQLLDGSTITNDFELKAFPNPAFDELNITALLRSIEPASVVLIDALGNENFNQTINLTTPRFSQVIKTDKFASGVYLLQIRQGSDIMKTRVVITK